MDSDPLPFKLALPGERPEAPNAGGLYEHTGPEAVPGCWDVQMRGFLVKGEAGVGRGSARL